MAIALYTKYRPKTFDDVVGQEHVVKTLCNALSSQRLSHAYLFCGPRGTGKTTLARIIAKACICQQDANNSPTPNPCGVCDDCDDIAAGLHEDVTELDAASRTGVDSVREEIINRVQYAPGRASMKVYIIDEVHMLSTAAFNALLKTLEEPPEHVIFVLCTTDPQKVPETIVSRCQRFDFRPLSPGDVVNRLKYVCSKEDAEWDDDALKIIAKNSQGGMRNALTQLEQGISLGNGKVTVESISQRNSIESLDQSINELLSHIGNNNLGEVFAWIENYCNTAYDFDSLAGRLVSAYRDIYISLSGVTVDSQIPVAIVNLYTAQKVQFVLSCLSDLVTGIKDATNKRLYFEVTISKITISQPISGSSNLEDRILQLEKEIEVLKEKCNIHDADKDKYDFAGQIIADDNPAFSSSTPEQPKQAKTEHRAYVPEMPDFEKNSGHIPKSTIPDKWPSDSRPVINKKLNSHPDVKFDVDRIEIDQGEAFDFTSKANISKLWKKVFSQIKKNYPMYAALLQKGNLVYDENERKLVIEMPAQHALYLDTFKNADSRRKIKEEFSSVLKCSFELSMRVVNKPQEKLNLMDILKEAGATNIITENNS